MRDPRRGAIRGGGEGVSMTANGAGETPVWGEGGGAGGGNGCKRSCAAVLCKGPDAAAALCRGAGLRVWGEISPLPTSSTPPQPPPRDEKDDRRAVWLYFMHCSKGKRGRGFGELGGCEALQEGSPLQDEFPAMIPPPSSPPPPPPGGSVGCCVLRAQLQLCAPKGGEPWSGLWGWIGGGGGEAVG